MMTSTASISIHSLRMEGDRKAEWRHGRRHHFNPLPPYGGRRLYAAVCTGKSRYFNPLPPYGGRPVRHAVDLGQQEISIHSLRMEGDKTAVHFGWAFRHFNPLPPYGGRPPEIRQCAAAEHFNPLPPYGGRQVATTSCNTRYIFQSTPSVWRETGSI